MITFTDYFTRQREVRDVFGGSFPDIWKDSDWDGYYNYIAEGIHMLMKNGGKLAEVEEGEMLWEKKFDHSYGMGSAALREWIHDMVIDRWSNLEHLKASDLQTQYETFCMNNNIKRDMSIPRLHKAIETWCQRNGWGYEYGVLKRVDGERMRVSVLTRTDAVVLSAADAAAIAEKAAEVKQLDIFDGDDDPPF